MTEITQLLERASQGENAAANQLMPIIYERLRAMAHRQLVQERQGMTLATTGLVNEAYLELFGETPLSWNDSSHFFAYAATAMRNILIDRARRRLAQKRGAEIPHMDVVESEIPVDDECESLLAMDQALTQMAQAHPRLVKVVEMRFFAGLSVEETATALNIDPRSVERDWHKARAFINRVVRGVTLTNVA